mmetsp:Transcript_5523/g.12125  ORF Transcript_5523/g.12125 Transcript_5523/m.12125 type:complete len:129 (+) Transcript_5523:77-463(+)
MARSIALVFLGVAALVALSPVAFVTAPRAVQVDAAAGVAAASVALPQAAGAFTFEGEEYFDIYFGISPVAWALCGFIVLTFAGFLKTSMTKYNRPIGKVPLKKKFVPLQQERPENFVGQKIKGFDTSF